MAVPPPEWSGRATKFFQPQRPRAPRPLLQGYTAIDASPTCKIRGPDEEVKTQQPVIYIPLPLLQTAATKKRLLSVFLSTFFFFLLICTLFKENAVSEVLWGV